MLVLTNVQSELAGSYSVWVSNMFGAVVSSNAILNVVTQQQQCINAPSGLVGWWKAEGNTEDSALNNDATVVGYPQYGPGKVGNAFLLGGSNAYSVATSPTMAVTSFTIEGWINPSAATPQPIAEYGNETGYGSIHLWHNIQSGGVGAPGALYGIVRGADGSYIEVNTSGNMVPAGYWTHVAFTLDFNTKVAQLFVNGEVMAIGTNQSLAAPDSVMQFNIGRRPEGSADLLNGVRFLGSIDELSVYNRALTHAEVDGIYGAGAGGKCSRPVGEAPVITIQPTNQTVSIGGQAAFAVQATGTEPLSYQWRLNDTVLSGATDRELVLTNVQAGQAGNYSVMVTNVAGWVLSSNALLTVVTSMPAPAGLVGWWAAESNALDSVGGNDGFPYGTVEYAEGKVGMAFALGGGTNHSVRIADAAALNPTNALTLETWVYVPEHSANDSVVVAGKDNPRGARQYMLGMGNENGKWLFRAHVGVVGGGYHYIGGTTEGFDEHVVSRGDDV